MWIAVDKCEHQRNILPNRYANPTSNKSSCDINSEQNKNPESYLCGVIVPDFVPFVVVLLIYSEQPYDGQLKTKNIWESHFPQMLGCIRIGLNISGANEFMHLVWIAMLRNNYIHFSDAYSCIWQGKYTKQTNHTKKKKSCHSGIWPQNGFWALDNSNTHRKISTMTLALETSKNPQNLIVIVYLFGHFSQIYRKTTALIYYRLRF